MKKIGTKEEESKVKFKTFLNTEKVNLKRKIDDILDEYLEPIIAIKKKLRKEVDSFVFSQDGVYEKEGSRENILKWKNDNELLVAKWETSGEGEVAAQLVCNQTEEVEKHIGRYDKWFEKVEGETQNKMDVLLRNIKSKVNLMKTPWKKMKKRLNDIINTTKSERDPEIEQKYLAEFLEECGIKAAWIGDEYQEFLELKKSEKEERMKEFEARYFDCTLQNLHVKAYHLPSNHIEVFYKTLEKIQKLVDFKISIDSISDQDVLGLVESIKKLRSMERLSIVIRSEQISQKVFKNIWLAATGFARLRALEISVSSCDFLRKDRKHRPN